MSRPHVCFISTSDVMAPHAEINPQDITERARRDLLQLLEGVRKATWTLVPGKKNLVIEKSLAGPIGLLVKFSTLQEYGVDKVFYVENRNRREAKGCPTHSCQSMQHESLTLSVAPPFREMLSLHANISVEQISQIRQESKTDHEFSVFWVPRRTLVSDRILEENGVLGEVTIGECPLFLIPLEYLVQMEIRAVLTAGQRKDPTSIFLTAKALMRLQKSTGLFPRILGKGDNAKKLADLLIRMRSEEEVSASSATTKSPSTFGLTPSAVVENVVIIDREVDFFTPLMTQLTYEGLIDEVFGVRHNQTEVDTSIVGAAPQTQKPQGAAAAAGNSTQAATKRRIQLDSSDKLYPQLRDCNFAVVGPLLNRTARRLQADYESRHKADQSISDLKTFVAKLPSYQAEQASLKIHTSMAEEIMKTTRSEIFGRVLEVQQNFAAGADPNSMNDNLEELIARDIPLSTILRLLSLESCVGGGIRPRELENLKRQIMYAYGHQHLLTFAALEKMGLVVQRQSNTGYLNPMGGVNSGNTDYNSVRKTLKLFVDEVDEQDPTDISCWLDFPTQGLQAHLTPMEQLQMLHPLRKHPDGKALKMCLRGSRALPSMKCRRALMQRRRRRDKRLEAVLVVAARLRSFMGEQLGEKKKIVVVTTGLGAASRCIVNINDAEMVLCKEPPPENFEPKLEALLSRSFLSTRPSELPPISFSLLNARLLGSSSLLSGFDSLCCAINDGPLALSCICSRMRLASASFSLFLAASLASK
ncbi:Sec1-like protein, partial [Aureobasidium melanogenum]